MKKTIVLGIGNPYLKDDRIGIKIVEELEVFFRNKKDVTFDFYYDEDAQKIRLDIETMFNYTLNFELIKYRPSGDQRGAATILACRVRLSMPDPS